MRSSRPLMKDRTLKRLMARVAVDLSTNCWLWTGARSKDGYGHIRFNGKPSRAHRVAYELLVGPIPADRPQLDHLCRTRRCVNPAHLEPVTSGENTQRGVHNRGVRQRAKTHCPQGHLYDEQNTRAYNGRRFCKLCDKTRSKKRRDACARLA